MRHLSSHSFAECKTLPFGPKFKTHPPVVKLEENIEACKGFAYVVYHPNNIEKHLHIYMYKSI